MGEDEDLNLDELFKGTTSKEEEFKAVKEFFSINGDTDIRTKTIISSKLVNPIIKLIYFSVEAKKFDKYDEFEKVSDIVNKIILENLYTLNISVRGKGREQFFKFFGAYKKEKEGVFSNLLKRD
jgi:hypothetical protein